MKIKSFFSAAMAVALCSGFAACGGDSDDDDNGLFTARVTQVFFDDAVIAVGEGTVVHVEFSFDASEVFDDGQPVRVAVHLPAQTAFRSGTAEIQGPADADDDVGAQVFGCGANAESFLLFDLNEDDLDLAENPNGDADAALTFIVDGVSPVSGGVVEAKASVVQPSFACGQPFSSDQSALITIAG